MCLCAAECLVIVRAPRVISYNHLEMCYGCPPNNFNGSVTENNGNKIKLSGGSSSRSTPLNEKHISIWGATFLKQPLLVDWSVKGGGVLGL